MSSHTPRKKQTLVVAIVLLIIVAGSFLSDRYVPSHGLAEAERLFQVINDATNEAVVRSVTSRLQQTFLDDPPALFLSWNEGARAVRRDFKVVQDPGRDPLSSIARWTAAAR